MKELTKKKDNKILEKLVSKQSYYLLEAIKEIFMSLLYIFISCYYIYTCIYNFSIDNCELITNCDISCVELEPVVNTQPNLSYKYILNEFFNKFTSNSKTINPKYMEIKSDYAIKTLIPLKDNLEIMKKSVILSKIKSDCIKSIISECEFYKDKTYLLEIQLFNTKIAYINLVKDINDIVKEMNNSSLTT